MTCVSNESSLTVMFSIRFAVWTMLFSGAVADFCSSDYILEYGCDVTYGVVLETISNTGSVIVCTELCNGNDKCLSVKYILTTGVCQLNSERYNTLSTDCQSFVYAKVTTTSCRKLVDHSCSSSVECSADVANSMCSSNKCQCNPGYSYRYTSESCDTACDVYGSTFTAHPDSKLLYHNDKAFDNITSSDECQQLCVEENTFVCRTVEYWQAPKTCFLSTETAFTVPDNYISDSGTEFYHRNCQ